VESSFGKLASGKNYSLRLIAPFPFGKPETADSAFPQNFPAQAAVQRKFKAAVKSSACRRSHLHPAVKQAIGAAQEKERRDLIQVTPECADYVSITD
jgi:hypothetical protein